MTMNHFRAEFFWEQAMPTSLEIEEINGDQPFQSYVFLESKQRLLAWKLKRSMASNPFRATFFFLFWEQEMPTSLEIEEINGVQPFQSYVGFWEQATPTSLEIEEISGEQPFQSYVFFESKQRLLAWKLKRSMAINPFRATFFLRASNTY